MRNGKRDIGFAERLVELRARLPLRNAKIVTLQEVAKEAGVNLGSYSRAENGIVPGEKVLIRIARYFNVTENYLLGKESVNHPKAPDVRDQVTPYIKEAPQDNPRDPQFKISEGLTKAAEVLESRTSYATALYLNIVHFHRAISAESEIENLKAENAAQRARIDKLETAVATLMAERETGQAEKKAINA